MKTLIKSIFLVALSFIALSSDAKDKKPKEPFPQEIIDLVNSQNFEISIEKIIGLPATVSNRESLPISFIKVNKKELKVCLPYYAGRNAYRQNTYNFSDFGRMLKFDATNVQTEITGLNKKETLYTMKTFCYGSQSTTFQVTLLYTFYPDATVSVSASWLDQRVQYLGKLVRVE